jgi:hypothetical protein
MSNASTSKAEIFFNNIELFIFFNLNSKILILTVYNLAAVRMKNLSCHIR